MLGYSLQSPVFLGKLSKETPHDLIARYESIESFLSSLRSGGIDSIEIRILPRGADERSYRDLIKIVWDMGFQLTVHGHVAGEHPGETFVEAYPSMRYILNHFHEYQEGLTMTLHAFEAKQGNREELRRRTVGLLREWSSMLQADDLPIRLALENNRRKSSKADPGDCIDGVLSMVNEVSSPYVGICWDMGHYYSNLLTASKLEFPPEEPLMKLPPSAFLESAYHTHIHGLGPSGTHNALTERNSLPLEHYVDALKQANYQGVYNLELTLDKFDADRSMSDHIAASVQRLKEAKA
ncbi:sugar phosphate isomerase/epimerase family protein [Cohnella herbarum]|uniref:Sugar phosphate isomerase/epimerase n=1 Tax=Cohnella herbarum TaxID=2728023 RepID=A0A7Z2VPV2_9BACL|nr:sugar phosphate isomerase/epimerase [Cohnella herbarum]QJD87273.1 sugar phosphate isomerase/epimerase [Cohnella herbarum]